MKKRNNILSALVLVCTGLLLLLQRVYADSDIPPKSINGNMLLLIVIIAAVVVAVSILVIRAHKKKNDINKFN